MNKILITLAALAAVSGSALAGNLERSDDDRPVMKRNSSAVIVEQAPLAAPSSSFIWDGAERRGGSNNSVSR